jgi:hypothetical protein
VKPIRNVNTNSNRLTYDSSSGEIAYEANTIAQIHDVSGASSAATGMGLIYNSAITTWEARQRGYLTVNAWGPASSSYFDNSSGKDLLAVATSAAWISAPTGNRLSICSKDISYNTSTGIITLDESKTYLIDINFIHSIVYDGTNALFVVQLINNDTSGQLAINKLSAHVNGDNSGYSIPLSYVSTGIQHVKFNIYNELTTTTTGSANNELLVSLKILEI